MSYVDDFTDMMLDVLTVEGLTAATVDQNTGVPSGAGTVRLILTQPCSDQDLTPGRRAQFEIANGVNGTMPASICKTAYFKLPPLQPNETLVYRVNSRFRGLLRQGPPADIGGQHQIMDLILGPAEDGR